MPLGSFDTARRYDTVISDLNAQYGGNARYEDQLFIPSSEAIATLDCRLSLLQDELTKEAGLTDFWQQHFSQMLRGMRWRLASDTRLPYAYIARLSSAVHQLLQVGRPQEERRALLSKKLAPVGDLFQAVLHHAAQAPPARREQISSALETLSANLGHALTHFASSPTDPLIGQLHSGQKLVEDTLTRIAALSAATESTPDPSFGDILSESLGISEDYVLSWYQTDFEDCLHQLDEMARRVDPSVTTRELLDRELPAPDSPEEMFALMQEYLKVARAASLDFITLPEGEQCEVGPVPEQHRMDCPWGLYHGGDAQRGELRGRVCLNQYNYRAITRGWLMLMAAHEGYPGHHAHYVKTVAQKLPLTFRSGLPLTRAMAEGIAHRSERLMQHSFDNPVYPVFVAYRRLHCALRVKAEVELNVSRRPAQEIIDLYQDIMGFNELSARVQVQAHLMYPADGVSYYTGMRVLEQLQRAGNYGEPDFTEAIFSHGSVSLSTIENIIRLPAEAREQLGSFNVQTKCNQT